MGEMDRAMGFIGMLGRKTNEGAKKFADKMKEEKHHYDLRKRGQVEAKTESMLQGAQLKRYRDILAAIAHDRSIATDERRPMQERMMAQGRVEGNRDIRNRIEKKALEALKPKKNNQNQNRNQQQGQNQNNSHPGLLLYDDSIMPPGGNGNGSNGSGSNGSGGRSSSGRSSGGGRRGRRTAGSRR